MISYASMIRYAKSSVLLVSRAICVIHYVVWQYNLPSYFKHLGYGMHCAMLLSHAKLEAPFFEVASPRIGYPVARPQNLLPELGS